MVSQVNLFKHHPEQLHRERERLEEFFPRLELLVYASGHTAVKGIFEVTDECAFSTDLQVPVGYPNKVPKLFCKPEEIPWELDRHVFPGSGVACLCVRSEYRKHWPPGSNLTDFLGSLVHPFFAGQLFYQVHGHWPTTGQRSHGRDGIIEAYTDFLLPLGRPTESQIESFMRLLARTKRPGGHEQCPCGSGLRLRHCHHKLLNSLRAQVDPLDAAADLAFAFRV